MGQKPIFKIGDTTIIADSTEEAAEKRVAQQDSTSCFENLTLDFAQEIPNTFLPKIDHVDKEFHKWLQKNKGIYNPYFSSLITSVYAIINGPTPLASFSPTASAR